MSIRDLGSSLVNLAHRLEQAAKPLEQKLENAVRPLEQTIAHEVQSAFEVVARHHKPAPQPSPQPRPTPAPVPAPGPAPIPDPKAAITPASIADVEGKYGWSQTSWQHDLLQAADSASGSPDGQITAAELDAYLAAPTDGKVLTSSTMWAAEKAVGSTHAADGFDSDWMNNLAKAADSNHDNQVTGTEMHSYVQSVVAGKQSGKLWLPDQKTAPLESRITDLTGEKDMLTVGGNVDGGNGLLLTQNYMRMVVDPQKRTPVYVSYELTAADEAEGPGAKRVDNFRPDPLMPDGPTPGDYKRSGLDRGHSKPSSDSVNVESMNETFLMTNMTPQQGALNQRSWNMLELATNELVRATGAKATICTGPLYLDKEGKPLPDDQIRWIGVNGQKRVAVPTEYFKAVVLQFPDGSVKTMAFRLPNDPNLSNQPDDMTALLKASMVSVDQVEEALGGTDLFQGIDPEVAAQIESNAKPDFSGVNFSGMENAKRIWGS